MPSRPLTWLISLAVLGSVAGAPLVLRAQEAPLLPAPARLPDLAPSPTDQAPSFLNRPLESSSEPAAPEQPPSTTPPFLETPMEPPLGFTGPSGVAPRSVQDSSDFVPREDRWRIGFPAWDRYGWGFPIGLDYPYKEGHWWDPYNQNVLKGDYPIIGQNTFLNLTGTIFTVMEPRQIPSQTTPFESLATPGKDDFFGKPNEFLYQQYFRFSIDLFHGDTLAFKPVDWRIKLTPVFNVNYLATSELGIVSPDVTKGKDRGRTFMTLEEWFAETKLADLSPNYDFVSVRVGSQPFVSDFRGFIFSDTNRGIRLFGTRLSNKDQFNVVYFRQAEKDTNSQLNTFNDRGQDILILNYYRQDFIWPGYTAQASIHYDHDKASMHYDRDGFLVRPDPAGVAQPHEVDAVYFGWTGDGHINRFNINHAFYWVTGRDTRNPIAGTGTDICAEMAALELSYDRDWIRFRTSGFWASGDRSPNNSHATGFDSILDSPNFAGGRFTYWQRQAVPLFGVGLTNRQSLVPDLRSSKFEGQANFVNPGLRLMNFGADLDLTPKWRMLNNMNFLWFDQTAPLSTFVFQQNIRHFMGIDLSTGLEYRPLLNNNIIMTFGLASLVPGAGFQDLYDHLNGHPAPLMMGFAEITLTF
jgi:hypothetical protein